jgi:hypothetical protein
MSYYLWLDDLRPTPKNTTFEWVAAKSLDEFKNLIRSRGAPIYVSFDHDLNETHYQWNYEDGKTGLDAINWMLEYLDREELPKWSVHTMNTHRGPIMKEKLLQHAEDRYLPSYLDLMGKPKGLEIRCIRCAGFLTEPGALIFSPPDKDGFCNKFHYCTDCYKDLVLYMMSANSFQEQ